MKHLSRLFILFIVAAAVMAMFDVRWEIIVASFAIGMIGLIVTAILRGRTQAKVYYKAVTQYAERMGLPAPSEERWDWLIVFGLFGLFMVGAFLAVFYGNPIIAFATFIPLFIVIALLGGRQTRQQDEAWRDLAARHNLTYEPRSFSNRIPRMYGTYREREVELKILTRRELHFSPGSVRHRRRTRTKYTQVTLAVDNPANFYLLARETEIKKSTPADFAHNLFQSIDLLERLTAVSPREITLHGQKLSFELGLITDLAGLQFLLDLMCDMAATIEKLSKRQGFDFNGGFSNA